MNILGPNNFTNFFWIISTTSTAECCQSVSFAGIQSDIAGQSWASRWRRWSLLNGKSYRQSHISQVLWTLTIYSGIDIWVRVANVVAHHNKLLTQWRYIWMSKLGINIFLISTTSNYLQSSAVCKNWSSRSWLFWFSRWNIWKICVN